MVDLRTYAQLDTTGSIEDNYLVALWPDGGPLQTTTADTLRAYAAAISAAIDLSNVGAQYLNTPLNPVAYGAAWNGVTDDTGAINAALTAAYIQGRDVFFPKGQVLCQPFSIPDGVEVTGLRKSTTIYFKRQAYTAYAAGVSLGNRSTLKNVIIDTNDPIFSDITGGTTGSKFRPLVAASSIRPRIENVELYGQGDDMALIYNCTDPQVIDLLVTVTGSNTFRAIQATGCTGGLILKPVVTGPGAQVQSHVTSIDTSAGLLLIGARQDLVATGGFSISLTGSASTHAAHCVVSNSQFEGFQMTGCTACTITDCDASWTLGVGVTGAGQDFGASMDGCVRCVFARNHFENSYKAACAVAADFAISHANQILDIRAHNCAVRGTAHSTGYDTAVFICYNSTYSNNNNLFSRLTIDNDAGSTSAYGYYEGGGSTTGNTVQDVIRAGGVVTTMFAPAGPTTTIRSDILESFTPALTAAIGAFGTAPAPTAAGQLRRDGVMIEGRVTATFPTGSISTAAGALIIQLPITTASSVWISAGREGVNTGSELSVTVQNGYAYVRTYSNGFPVASGGAIDIGFRASIQ
jgi:hypothetical protein